MIWTSTRQSLDRIRNGMISKKEIDRFLTQYLICIGISLIFPKHLSPILATEISSIVLIYYKYVDKTHDGKDVFIKYIVIGLPALIIGLCYLSIITLLYYLVIQKWRAEQPICFFAMSLYSIALIGYLIYGLVIIRSRLRSFGTIVDCGLSNNAE
jgi:hypothetical protein